MDLINMFFGNIFASLLGLKEDERGLDGIVVAIILVIVAVTAAILFRTTIMELVQSLLDKIPTF